MNNVISKKTYKEDFNKIVKMIESSKERAYRKVNEELITLYWEVGKYVSGKISTNEWGSKVVDNLVLFIKEKYPTLKGFDRSGIYRMKQFYEIYKNDEIVAPLVRQLNWTNNKMIMARAKSKEEREFYIKMCIKNNYTKIELDRQLSSAYYERYMLSSTDIKRSLVSTIDEDDHRFSIQNWMRNKDVISYLGLWESINNENFKRVEFDSFKNEAGSNKFKISSQKWIKETNAIGIVSKFGKYGGGTYARSNITFEFASWLRPEFKLYVIQEF